VWQRCFLPQDFRHPEKEVEQRDDAVLRGKQGEMECHMMLHRTVLLAEDIQRVLAHVGLGGRHKRSRGKREFPFIYSLASSSWTWHLPKRKFTHVLLFLFVCGSVSVRLFCRFTTVPWTSRIEGGAAAKHSNHGIYSRR
jgi:hypothetical protein